MYCMRVELKCSFADTCGESSCTLAEKIELRDDEMNRTAVFPSFLQSFISQKKKKVIGISKKNTINNYILSLYDVNEEN